MKCIDEEIPFEVPKGWEWCRFSSLYLSLTDGTHSTPKYTLSGIPFISVKDMSSGVIDFQTQNIYPKKNTKSFLIDAIPKRRFVVVKSWNYRNTCHGYNR